MWRCSEPTAPLSNRRGDSPRVSRRGFFLGVRVAWERVEAVWESGGEYERIEWKACGEERSRENEVVESCQRGMA